MDGAGAAKRLQSKVISEGAAHKSPERSRRKEKWVTERKELPVEEEGANRRRLQDPVALEDNAMDEGNGRRPFKRGRYEQQQHHQNPRVVAQRNDNPEYVPRSGHFYEHDDRSSWRPRSTPRRRPFEGGRIEDRGTVRKADERWDGGVQEEAGARGSDRWHHDRFEHAEAKKGRPPGRFNGGRSRDGGRGTGRRVGIQRMNGRGKTQADRGRWGDEEPPRGGRNEPARVARSRGPPPSANEDDTRGNRQPAREWKHDLFDHHSPAAKREEASVALAEALLAS